MSKPIKENCMLARIADKAQKYDRIVIYLPKDERQLWKQALSLSKHRSMSSLVRDLVRKYHHRTVKRLARECSS